MRKKVNRLLIYKSDASEIIDVSENLTSLTYEAGSVEETGDTTADNPVKTINFSLKNTNKMQFSPHFEKGKYVYDYNFTLTLDGSTEYNLPFPYTVEVVSLTEGYHVQLLNKKIFVDSWGLPLTGVDIKIGLTYIDISENNPLNFIDTEYAPLLKNGNRVSWYRDDINVTFEDYFIQGNGTDEIILYNTYNLFDLILTGAKVIINPINYYEICQENYYLKCKENYYKLGYNGTNDSVPLGNDFFRLSLMNFYDLSKENYKELCYLSIDDTLRIVSTNKVGNELTVKFNRIITSEEWLFLSASWEQVLQSVFKFDGYIYQDPQSDIESVEVNCLDRSFDLQNITGTTSESFRGYDSSRLDDNSYEVLEVVATANFINNIATSSYTNYSNLFTVGQQVRIKDGNNYIKCTVGTVTSNSLTLIGNTIPNGKHAISKVYVPGIPLPQFLYKCLQDTGLGYSVFDLGAETFVILPKAEELEYDDLWNLFQSFVVKTPNLLSFKNVNGNFELVLEKIPLEFGEPKYHITSDDILDEKTHWLASTDIRTSWKLKYQLYKDGNYTTETIIKDDFIESLYSLTVTDEMNLIDTGELLYLNDFIRINKEYYKVVKVESSSIYRLNKNVIEESVYTLYTKGQYTASNGIKRASIELDSTSAIDSVEEAEKFGDLLLYQTREPYSIFKISLNADEFELNNFDTIKVTCPEFSLYDELVFVQSVNENYSIGSNKITITFSKKQQLGKTKFKEMITERGLNQVVTSNKINTNVKLPAPQNLQSEELPMENYSIPVLVKWDSLIGALALNYELQYKKSTDDWNKTEVIKTQDSSIKLYLKEPSIYDIRVRGIGKEGINGNFSDTSIDIISKFDIPTITGLTSYIVVDQSKNYQVYADTTFTDLTNKNLINYELQYKKQSEQWELSQKINLVSNSVKIPITEQDIYNIRVRGIGANNTFGEWTTTTIDASSSFDLGNITGLVANSPAIDDLQNYVVYSSVYWNSLIGKNLLYYELQYKKSTSTWDIAETITTKETALKVVIKEQKLYNVRVRGVGKDYVTSNWTETTVDASKYLIENPIKDRTWYINLKNLENKINDYMIFFNKLGYSKDFILNNIDNIEITLSNGYNCGLFSMMLIINGAYITDFNLEISHKNFFIKGSLNKELFIEDVILKPFYRSLNGEKNITKIVSKYTDYITEQKYSNFSATDSIFLSSLKDFDLYLENSSPNLDVSTKIIDGNGQLNIDNVKVFSEYAGIKNKMIAFYRCRSIKESYANNFFENYVDSFNLLKNSSSNSLNSGFKYRTCFSGFTATPTNLIPDVGDDSAQFGWNT